MRFLAITNHGLSELLVREFNQKFGIKATAESESKVLFETEMEELIEVFRRSQGIYRICALISKVVIDEKSEEAKRQVREWIKSCNLSRYMDGKQKFAVRAHRFGDHQFRSVDIAAWGGEAIINWFTEEKKIRPKVDLTHPETLFRIYVIEETYWLTLDLTGTFAIERNYRRFDHPAGLRSQLAFLAVLLSEWNSNEGLLFDPTTGSGTIPIEAILFNQRKPISDHHWNDLLLHNWKEWKPVELIVQANKKETMKLAIGQDRSSKFIKYAETHAQLAGVSTNIDFRQVDFLRSPHIPKDVTHIVFNPPFGVRMGKKEQLERLYTTIFQSAKEYGIKTVTQFMTKRNLIREIADDQGYSIAEEYRFSYGGITVFLVKFQS
ncbi:MAG: hypothetical protein D6732_21365 [Methanobacteriota archaeon]|nr:MAG: hypothetical protein D6732_21365 [Euryarchaeota archaeon]